MVKDLMYCGMCGEEAQHVAYCAGKSYILSDKHHAEYIDLRLGLLGEQLEACLKFFEGCKATR